MSQGVDTPRVDRKTRVASSLPKSALPINLCYVKTYRVLYSLIRQGLRSRTESDNYTRFVSNMYSLVCRQNNDNSNGLLKKREACLARKFSLSLEKNFLSVQHLS